MLSVGCTVCKEFYLNVGHIFLAHDPIISVNKIQIPNFKILRHTLDK